MCLTIYFAFLSFPSSDTGTSVHDGSGTLPVQAALTLAMVDSVHKTVAATLAPMRRDDVIRHLKQCAPEVTTRAILHVQTHTSMVTF
jgi:hypothetical protein